MKDNDDKIKLKEGKEANLEIEGKNEFKTKYKVKFELKKEKENQINKMISIKIQNEILFS